jgi:hypothetical protein
MPRSRCVGAGIDGSAARREYPALLGPVVAAAQAAYFQQIVLISAFALNHNEQAPTLREHNAIYLAAGDGKTAPRRLDFTASSRTQPLRKARSLVTRRPGKELMDRVLQYQMM